MLCEAGSLDFEKARLLVPVFFFFFGGGALMILCHRTGL